MLPVQMNAYDSIAGTNVPLQVDSNGNLKTNNNKGFHSEPLTITVEDVIPTLAFAPDSQSSMMLFAGGSIQTPGVDYTLSGQTVTWGGTPTLTVGLTVIVSYLYTITP